MPRPLKPDSPTERMNLMVDPALRHAIKTWRHKQMIDTEGEAVRRLIRTALMHEGEMLENAG